MKDKKIRILCAVTALFSLIAVICVMFRFFEDYYSNINYNVWGFQLYTDKEQPVNIVLGVFGLFAFMWDMAYCAYALIDGRYRNLTWRIARYGYFFGVLMAVINLIFIIINIVLAYSLCGGSIAFLVVLSVIIILKVIIFFTKDEDTKLKL